MVSVVTLTFIQQVATRQQYQRIHIKLFKGQGEGKGGTSPHTMGEQTDTTEGVGASI